MGQRPGFHKGTAPQAKSYAGMTTCLRCDAEFMSWDRRQNRLCQRCREAMAQEASDEAPYRIPKPKGRRPDADEG
jgi:predicted amidophosphoribosyltransferase